MDEETTMSQQTLWPFLKELVHYCHADGCNIKIHPSLFMCKPHWLALPQEMKRNILDHYVKGQEVTKNPTREYIEAAQRAIRWTKNKEKGE